MGVEGYQQKLAPLLDATSPAARFMVKAMLDEAGSYSINLDPDDYRRLMAFFRVNLDPDDSWPPAQRGGDHEHRSDNRRAADAGEGC